MTGKRVLGIVLAGGAGKRLWPLTAERAKAAVPFGGLYRLVDFALSNLVNGGIRRICVLTQYKSHSLNRHLATAWGLSSVLGDYVTPVPAQQWLGPYWQAGSADAIYQSLSLLDKDRPDLVVVCGADHVYRMDPAQMIGQHIAWGAGVTVAAIPVPRTAATDFGVVRTAADGHCLEAFLEKPTDPPGRPGRPDEAFASMGIYVFDPDVLIETLRKDAADDDSRHSIGGDIIPRLVRERAAHVYDFRQNEVPGADARDRCYWRDLGTIDSYFAAHMDLCAVNPVFNLYNDRWPISTRVSSQPPAKFVHDEGDRVGRAINSVVSNGVIVSGGLVRNSVLSPGARVDSWSRVERAVILRNSRVHRHAVVENAILDKNVAVLEGATVGVDKEHDRARGLVVSAGGVTVVSKGRVVAPLPSSPITLWGGGRHRPASAGRLLERAVAGSGLIDPGGPSGRHVEVGLDHGYRRLALVAGDVHVPEARVEEAGAGPVAVRRARRVVAVVEGEGSPDDDDEGRAGVRVPAGRAAGVDGGRQDDRVGRMS